jgi:hypothetical protein
MARICPPCKFYSADGSATVCPTCAAPTQFTLLPPPNQAAAPLPGVPLAAPRPPVRSDSDQAMNVLWSLLANRWTRGLVLLPVLLIIGLIFRWSADSVQTKYQKITLGMTMEQVDRILDPDTGSWAFRHRHQSAGQWIDNDEDNMEGPAHWEWQENGVTIIVDFIDAKVVKKSAKGLK